MTDRPLLDPAIGEALSLAGLDHLPDATRIDALIRANNGMIAALEAALGEDHQPATTHQQETPKQ